MKMSVQARLDAKTQATLEGLVRRLGWSTSEVVREGIHLVEQKHAARMRPRLSGAGCVSFGPGDLATNKKRLKDLGRKSMGKGWIPPEERAG